MTPDRSNGRTAAAKLTPAPAYRGWYLKMT